MGDKGGYGSVTNEELQEFVTKRGNQLLGYSKQKFLELKKYADDGNWSWRVAGLFAGIAIMAYAAMSFLAHLTGLSPATAVIDIYLFIFGLSSVLLEFKDQTFTKRGLEILKREALFLYRPYGRALFYVFVGVLILATGGLLGLLVGGYVTAVGVFVYVASRDAVKRLDQLKGSLHNDQDLAQKFKEFDKDNTGYLESKELAALCQSLGTNLTIHELESAILLLDSNSDGKISYNEFLDWWKGREDLV
eukprot:gene8845-9579_t